MKVNRDCRCGCGWQWHRGNVLKMAPISALLERQSLEIFIAGVNPCSHLGASHIMVASLWNYLLYGRTSGTITVSEKPQ